MKERSASAGGNWTHTLSKEKRPLKGSSIANKAKEVVQKICNIYQPLEARVRIDGSLPSGWDENDVHMCMLANLYMASEARAGSGSEPIELEEDGVQEEAVPPAQKEAGDLPMEEIDPVEDMGPGGPGPSASCDSNVPPAVGPDDEANDMDADVFAKPTQVDKELATNYTEATLLNFAKLKHPMFFAYIWFGAYSADPMNWMGTQTFSTTTKGGVSNTSRKVQQEASAERAAAAAGKRAAGAAREPDDEAERRITVVEQATRLHATKLLSYKMGLQKLEKKHALLQTEASKKALIAYLDTEAPTFDECVEIIHRSMAAYKFGETEV